MPMQTDDTLQIEREFLQTVRQLTHVDEEELQQRFYSIKRGLSSNDWSVNLLGFALMSNAKTLDKLAAYTKPNYLTTPLLEFVTELILAEAEDQPILKSAPVLYYLGTEGAVQRLIQLFARTADANAQEDILAYLDDMKSKFPEIIVPFLEETALKETTSGDEAKKLLLRSNITELIQLSRQNLETQETLLSNLRPRKDVVQVFFHSSMGEKRNYWDEIRGQFESYDPLYKRLSVIVDGNEHIFYLRSANLKQLHNTLVEIHLAPASGARLGSDKLRSFILGLAAFGTLVSGQLALKPAYAAEPMIVETRVDGNRVTVLGEDGSELENMADWRSLLPDWKTARIEKEEARRGGQAAQSGFLSTSKEVYKLLPIPEQGMLKGHVKLDIQNIRDQLKKKDEFENFSQLIFEVFSIHGGNYYVSHLDQLSDSDQLFIRRLISEKTRFAKIVETQPEGIIVEAHFGSGYAKLPLGSKEFAMQFEGFENGLPNVSALRVAEELAHFLSGYLTTDGIFVENEPAQKDLEASLGKSAIAEAMTRFTDHKARPSGKTLYELFKALLDENQAELFLINPIRVWIELADAFQKVRWSAVSA